MCSYYVHFSDADLLREIMLFHLQANSSLAYVYLEPLEHIWLLV